LIVAKLFPPKSSIWAAGGVVTRTRKGKREFLLVHRPRYNDWSLPKGKLDGKESFRAAALREVKEETGKDAEVIAQLGTIAYSTRRRNHKVVRYWLLDSLGGTFVPNREVNKIVWLTVNKARHVLTYNRDREILSWADSLLHQPKAARAYLVRHADADTRKKWKRNEARRPLSKRGKRQARDITDRLTRVPVTGVRSATARSCIETVEGLAATVGLKLVTDTALSQGAKPKSLRLELADLRGEARVLCSHGDVVQAYIESLSAAGVRLDGAKKWQKGSIWIIDLYKGEVTSATYREPTS
jgi:8-oxo-dGTP diphosphatase